jgi:hypothetical protein
MQDTSGSSPEVVLMTCALFICFEMFQNHHESALCQMCSGIYVFFDWHSKRNIESQQGSPRSNGRASKLAVRLQQIFGRLMLQTILFVDTRPHEWQFLTPAFVPAMPSMPATFTSIEEARNSLNSCLCALYHGALTAKFHGIEYHEINELPFGPEPQPSGGPLHDWKTAFDFFISQNVVLTSREQQAAIILETLQVTGYILASASAFSDESIFDLFEPSFSQIVALGSRLIALMAENPQDSASMCPTFDMGILPPLYFVASRCRDPLIRRQALHLLRQGPSQEGIWHAVMLSNIAERLITLEETGNLGARSSLDIPATARLTVLNATIHSAERTVALHCCRPDLGEAGTTHVIHELVQY